MKKWIFAVALATTVMAHAANDTDKAPEQATACVACHGEKGISVNPEWPSLAGQHAKYLYKELQDFKAGKTRSGPLMAAIIPNLSDDDMRVLANYYAHLPRGAGKTPKKYLARGEKLYRGGDLTKGITACIACHGPKGTGNGQAGFPVVSGQQAVYTIKQLNNFKDHKRTNDLNSIMQDIANRMAPEDMEAVAYYMQGLH